MKNRLLIIAAAATVATPAFSQRVMEKLDRGLVAAKAATGNFVSWRVLGEDADNVLFNVYRDGTLLNSEPLAVSNFTDASGSASSKYMVKTVVNGVEKDATSDVAALSTDYLEIKIAPVPSNKDGKDISGDYEPNDAIVADLDGDGELEIIIKLRNNKFHNSGYPEDSTDYDIIQAYKLDGTLLWWIDCGRNMVDFQSNEINIAAYDWDGDGKAECVMRAADGTTIHFADGTTQVIGDPTVDTLADARNNGMTEKFTHTGAEYLLYFEGLTAKPYQIKDYPLVRLEKGETDLKDAWGDGYGHRSSKHFFGAPYLDGRKPSIFLARGIYTRHKMIAYDVDPATHELVERWRWFNNNAGTPWYGQGYHNYTVADVDWDGRDEIVFGSMVIDDNGRGLSTTGLGHGDSMHVGDFNPYIYGSEVVACNEENPNNNYRDATTSKIYYRTTANSDDGRAIAGNFSNEYPGAQFITSHDSQTLISTVINAHLDGAGPTGDVAQNFRIYWDGDLLDETFNYRNGQNTPGTIYKYKQGAIRVFEGTATNNSTKGTPCFQGDIFGDWREEVVLRSADNKSIRIYTTTIPTEHRIYTLLHDPQYRNAMVWQMNGYNQTPHPSFFLGELEGITRPTPSPTMTGRKEVSGTVSGNGEELVFAATSDATANVVEGAAPALFMDNAPSWVQGNDNNDNIKYEYFTHTLTGGGFGGDTKIVKLGGGRLIMPAATHNHKGVTEIWQGEMVSDGVIAASPVWMNRHTTLTTDGGSFGKGVEMDYNATLNIGSDSKASSADIKGGLKMNFGSRLALDLFADGSCDKVNADVLTVGVKDWENGPEYSTPVIEFRPHYADGATSLAAGKYDLGVIGKVEGDIADIKIEGLAGQSAKLAVADGHLVLDVVDTRAAGEVIWSGKNGSTWDLGETANFTLKESGEETEFVTGDCVIFDDTAETTTVEIPAGLYPSKIIFNNSAKDYVISGEGFEGELTIEKRGTGRVTLLNSSKFNGGVTIYNGIIEASSLGASEGTATGSFGQYTNEITLQGGVVSLPAGKMSHPVTAVDGGIEVKSGEAKMVGVGVKGDGVLEKTGAGRLTFQAANKISTLRISEGSVYDEGDTHNIASTVEFNGKNVQLIHNNSTGSYSSDNTAMVVNEGATARFELDGRCDYTGRLTGKGEIEVYATWIRNYLKGDWSEFEGTLIASQRPKGGGSDYGSSFDFQSSKGLPKATLRTNCAFIKGSGEMKVGAIAGGGSLAGSGTYIAGGNGQDASFMGTFGTDINFVKEGSGYLTINKPQVNMGTFTHNEGELEISGEEKSEESMTGSRELTVRATVTGHGHCGNSTATFESGAVLNPNSYTKSSKFRRLTFGGDLVMNQGSVFASEIAGAEKYGSIAVAGNATFGCTVEVTFDGYTPKNGESYLLWTAGSADNVPVISLPELPEGLAWDITEVTPTQGLVKVTDNSGISELPASTPVRVRVATLSGIIVREADSTAGAAMEALRDLDKGVYVVIISGEGVSSRKVVAL